ncbi:hypothetical protein P3612_11190 [Vibrio parahaemolyticus]|uniref:hypothetical protein n=1 Tax=unclassified Vibrio TaxID=2614977 RepID=UPI002A00B1E5|nr:hypothetical protein [Vibrio parahaemolyticus]
MFFNTMASGSVQREIMNMVWGFEHFLDAHTGKIPTDATEEEMSMFVIDEAGLVCNELHYLDKGGNGTPSGTCTSEAQSFHILGYIWLYKATGNQYFLDRAKYFWQAYFDYLYLGAPLPKDENQILHAHWMLNIKREFPSAYPNNFDDGSAAGFLGEEIEFTDGVAYIPHGAPYYGEQLQLAYQAFNPDDLLVYSSVKASVATQMWEDAKAYQVASFINHQGWKLDSSGDRIDEIEYPDEEKGRVELGGVFVNTVGEGTQLPDETITGTMKLCFSCNNGVLIRQKDPFDPRPVWAPLVEGTQGNAADGEEWFMDSCLLLWQITGEDKYHIMYKTCLNTLKGYCSIDSNLRIFRKDPLARSPHTDGISYTFSYPTEPGAATLTRIQHPMTHPYFGCIKVDCSTAAEDETGKHSTWLENSGTWYKVAPTSKLSWELAAEVPENVSMRYTIEVAEVKDDSGVTKVFRCPQFEQISLDTTLTTFNVELNGACTVTETSPHFANCFYDETMAEVTWRKVVVDGNTMWYRALEWKPDITKNGECWLNTENLASHIANGVQSLEIIKYDNVAANKSGWHNTLIEFEAATGERYRVNPGWTSIPNDQPNTIISKDLSNINAVPAINGVKYWEAFDAATSTWVRLAASLGNPVESLEIVSMKLTDITHPSLVIPTHSPTGFSLVGVNNFHEEAWDSSKYIYVLRNTIEFYKPDLTTDRPIVYVGNATLIDILEDQLAYTPGLVPFSNNWQPEANAYSSWRGIPYLGYQYPVIFREDPLHWNNMLNCLYDSQQDYPNGAPGRPLGPHRSAYIWNRPDNITYGTADTFTDYFWGSSEPWDGYQPRITWAIGRAYYDQVVVRNEEADSRLVEMMSNWISFLYDFLIANDNQFPTGFKSDGVPFDDGWNGHMIANYITGVALALIAGHEDLDEKGEYILDTAIASFNSEYFVSPGDGTHHMNGCWSSWPEGGQFFGFWAGNIYQAFGTYLMYQATKQGRKTY